MESSAVLQGLKGYHEDGRSHASPKNYIFKLVHGSNGQRALSEVLQAQASFLRIFGFGALRL